MSYKSKLIVLRMKEIIILLSLSDWDFFSSRFFSSCSDRAGRRRALRSRCGRHFLSAWYVQFYLTLGSQAVNVEVTVDSTQITSVTCRPLSDSIETMYPLLSSSASHLSEQIVSTQSLENLSFESGSQYTSQALLNVIHTALAKAIL